MSELRLVPLELLHDHPHNPRFAYDEETINGMVTAMEGGEFPKDMAVTCMPSPDGNGFQIISGHTRKRAAEKAGVKMVWCFVDEAITETEALLSLVLYNLQKGLDPVEIGINCYLVCDLAAGGHGLTGGVSEYARRLGKSKATVSRLRSAGMVVQRTVSKWNSSCAPTSFKGMSVQLYEISKMPENCWSKCCDWLVNLSEDSRKQGVGTVADVSERVAMAMSMRVPKEHKGTALETKARLQMFLTKKSQLNDEWNKVASSSAKPLVAVKPKAEKGVVAERRQGEGFTSIDTTMSKPVKASQPKADAPDPSPVPTRLEDTWKLQEPETEVPEKHEETNEVEVAEVAQPVTKAANPLADDEFFGVEPLTMEDVKQFARRLALSGDAIQVAALDAVMGSEDMPENALKAKHVEPVAKLINGATDKVRTKIVEPCIPHLNDPSKIRILKEITNIPDERVLSEVRRIAKKHLGEANINLVDKPSSAKEVMAYARECRDSGKRVDAIKYAEMFWDHFESKGWQIEKGKPVVNWKARFLIYCRMLGGNGTLERRVDVVTAKTIDTIGERRKQIIEENKRIEESERAAKSAQKTLEGF
ncbi:ParB N-terminal domain-containing protein [Rhodopirellula sp. ICT_H3.1]|uniref:ParB N-terminal domain-containing protein n=2 Tax=Aporhodopirellula aestuarii TaxID=2950107 RepID=A0ABT0U361_9BACT|nr:ParB N-terminal domain-containing protein [Aporhodopirellula aestuarii]